MDRRRLLSIGRFARITGLTVRALRHYDELGLLRPASVDRHTGYRYYESHQVADAVAVRRLRDIELPLDEIAALLATRDEVALARSLAAHRERMTDRSAEMVRILDDVNRYLADAEAVFATSEAAPQLREIPEQAVLAVRVRSDAEELAPVVLDAFARGRRFLLEQQVEPTGPPTLVAPFPDEWGLHEFEAARPIGTPIKGSGDVLARTLPAAALSSRRTTIRTRSSTTRTGCCRATWRNMSWPRPARPGRST